jgi:deazaflavin-dependent oxidoreductase (nitroreductase family)
LYYLLLGVLIGALIAAILSRSVGNMDASFRQPSQFERIFNRLFGVLVGIGLALPHNYLLEVRGRKSGRIYTAPIDLLERNGRRYLVCPRGRSQWVRNAEAAGQIALRRGSTRTEYKIRALAAEEKPGILKDYLDSFKTTVRRYFPVPPGSPAEALQPYVDNYPVFELIPAVQSA